MATDEILRLHYYERQYLGAADLEDQQTYLRDMRRRHNIGHHTWGIVTGLLLVEVPVAGDPTAVDVFIQPGMAVDGFGREIIVMSPVKLDPQLFESFANQQHRSVWISYDQELANQATGGYVQCNSSNQFGRIQETYKFVVDPKPPTHDDVMVNGKKEAPGSGDFPIAVDDSIPYQEFPDDNNQPEWLIPLGWVNWDGVGVKFIPTNPASRLTDDRSYVGVVAETIYGPMPAGTAPTVSGDAPSLFIQPRDLPADTSTFDFDKADFAEIKGRLLVDGRIAAKADVVLRGSKLQFKDSAGSEEGIPLWMQRTAGPSGTGTDLRVHIGDDVSDDTARLSIGPKGTTTEKTVFAVNASDAVHIPTGSLNFGSNTRQMINLWKDQYGIGVQGGTEYFRTAGEFCWFRGGKHSDTQEDPGSGGSLQMSLDSAGNLRVANDINVGNDLNFGAATRQMINLWNSNYGIGVQNSTFYSRTDFDFCWFRRGTHVNARNDPGGGVLAMKLDSGNNLSVMGDVSVAGNLSVTGTQNIFRVIKATFSLSMNGATTPRFWDYLFPAIFSEVYTAFVVMHGFSIWNNEGDINFTNFNHDQSVGAIPQHAFVKIDIITPGMVQGQCFCSESDESLETDNTVLFTVIVMGRPL